MKNLTRQVGVVIVMGVCLVTLCASPSVAADAFEMLSLKGLRGVHVVVEELAADVQEKGVTAEAIKTDAELKLRQSGVTVYSNRKSDSSPASASLYISINSNAARGKLVGLYAVSIRVRVQQVMRSLVVYPDQPLFSVEQLVEGTTWDRESVAIVGADNLRQVRDPVKDKVDEFINDYLTANPKRP